MAYNMTDKMEWTLIFVWEFGRNFGLTLKQAFNYLSRFGGIKSQVNKKLFKDEAAKTLENHLKNHFDEQV